MCLCWVGQLTGIGYEALQWVNIESYNGSAANSQKAIILSLGCQLDEPYGIPGDQQQNAAKF